MNMIKVLQRRLIEFFVFNIKNLTILALSFSGVITGSSIYAKNIFNVELICKGHDQEYCDIVKNSDKNFSNI